MLERCRTGSFGASVTDVETETAPIDGVMAGFRIAK